MKRYLDKDLLKHLFHKLGISVSRYKKNKHDQVVSLKPDGKSHGKALLGLIIDPFLLDEGEEISNEHTNHQESMEIAKVFLELGYEVDVISKLRGIFIPKKKYTFYVNLRTNFKNVGKRLNDDCIKIAHLDTCHWSFSNHSATKRVLNLQKRRGKSLDSIRYITPNYAIEYCDYATTKGNKFTINTYGFANKKIYQTKIPTYRTYEWFDKKDYHNCKNNFLWFGSSGFVHKGLDLVLEAFADLPEHNLTVCGPILDDDDFKREYHSELFETPNITTKGWVDNDSQEFLDIAKNNVALIFPSCAEAFNGGVTTCMQAGIIPIVSRETGMDINSEYGIELEESSINEIKKTAQKFSELPELKIEDMSRKAWKYARNNHTIEKFHEDYKKAIQDIVSMENKKRSSEIKLK